VTRTGQIVPHVNRNQCARYTQFPQVVLIHTMYLPVLPGREHAVLHYNAAQAALLVLSVLKKITAIRACISDRVRDLASARGIVSDGTWRSRDTRNSRTHFRPRIRSVDSEHKTTDLAWQQALRGEPGYPLSRYAALIFFLPGSVCAPSDPSFSPSVTSCSAANPLAAPRRPLACRAHASLTPASHVPQTSDLRGMDRDAGRHLEINGRGLFENSRFF
jgi:hypothetical protein